MASQQRMKALPPVALAEALRWMDIGLQPELVQRALQCIGNGLADSR